MSNEVEYPPKPKRGSIAEARADSLFAWLTKSRSGDVPLDGRTYLALKMNGWSRSQVDRAVDLLVEQGRVTLGADRDGVVIFAEGKE